MACIGGIPPCTGLANGEPCIAGLIPDPGLAQITLGECDSDDTRYLANWTGGEAYTRFVLSGPQLDNNMLLFPNNIYTTPPWIHANIKVINNKIIPNAILDRHQLSQQGSIVAGVRYKYEAYIKLGTRERFYFSVWSSALGNVRLWIDLSVPEIAWRDSGVLNEYMSSLPDANGFYHISFEFIATDSEDFFNLILGSSNSDWTHVYAGNGSDIDYYIKNQKMTVVGEVDPPLKSLMIDNLRVPFDIVQPVPIGEDLIIGESYTLFYRTETDTHYSPWQISRFAFVGTTYMLIGDGLNVIIDGLVPDYIID